MKSVTVRASEARVTCVKFNADGDLLFTAGADGAVTAWRTSNGERVGTYHYVKANPYAWSSEDLVEELTRPARIAADLDVNPETTELAVCRFDTVLIFDVASGRLTDILEQDGKVECVEWCRAPARQDMLLAGVTALGGGSSDARAAFKVYRCTDLDNPRRFEGERHWDLVCECSHFADDKQGGAPSVCGWGPLDQTIIGGTTTGRIYMWGLDGKVKDMKVAHAGSITSISFSKDRSVFVTASLDKTAKLWSALDLTCISEIKADRLLNACSLHPHFSAEDNHSILLAGGQEANQVTTSAADAGFFETLIVDVCSGEEQNRVLAHYSPTLCVCYHPSGRLFATGAYEGNSKIISF